VKGPGTLVPEHIRWITADTAGRVERINIKPGARVEEGTALLELANPDVMLQALEAERQVANAEAELLNVRATLQGARLEQESRLATLKAEAADARRRAEADEQLHARELLSTMEAKGAQEKRTELEARVTLESQRRDVIGQSEHSRMAAMRAQLEKLRAVAEFRKKQVESMQVKAGGKGVLQELPLELGQWVTPGTLLAKVVQPEELKAELKIPETQAKDLSVGQVAEVDTRNGVIPGHVTRIAPSAKEGTVLVEVGLEGALPKGARPDLTVEGVVQIEKLSNVLHLGRPAGAQPESTMELFVLTPDGDAAVRTRLGLGRSSVSTIEIRDGVKEGDKVVLSDMSTWDNAERVRFR
jgi:multidrug resistance efflux pump